MAPSATSTIFIRTAPGTVWKAWCDLAHWPHWQPETAQVYWLDGDAPWAEGRTFMLRRRTPYPLFRRLPGANERRFVGKVLSVAQEQLLVWELRPTRGEWFGPTLVESVRLSPAPGGTNVTLTLTAHGLGPTLLAFLVGGPLRAQAEATLYGLQRHLAPIERRQ